MSDANFVRDETPVDPDLDWKSIIGHILAETINIGEVLSNSGILEHHPGLDIRVGELILYCESVFSILP